MTKYGWLAVPAVLFACSDSVNVNEVPPTFFRAGAGERRVSSVEYDTLWSYGGVRDTILVAPDVLLAKPDGIYTLDVGAQQVVKFTFDGDVEWGLGTDRRRAGRGAEGACNVAGGQEILLVESVGGRNARDLLTASFSRNNLGSLR